MQCLFDNGSVVCQSYCSVVFYHRFNRQTKRCNHSALINHLLVADGCSARIIILSPSLVNSPLKIINSDDVLHQSENGQKRDSPRTLQSRQEMKLRRARFSSPSNDWCPCIRLLIVVLLADVVISGKWYLFTRENEHSAAITHQCVCTTRD